MPPASSADVDAVRRASGMAYTTATPRHNGPPLTTSYHGSRLRSGRCICPDAITLADFGCSERKNSYRLNAVAGSHLGSQPGGVGVARRTIACHRLAMLRQHLQTLRRQSVAFGQPAEDTTNRRSPPRRHRRTGRGWRPACPRPARHCLPGAGTGSVRDIPTNSAVGAI